MEAKPFNDVIKNYKKKMKGRINIEWMNHGYRKYSKITNQEKEEIQEDQN